MRERRRKNEREGGGEAERRSEREGAAGGYLCLCRAWDGSNRVIIYIDKGPAPPNTQQYQTNISSNNPQKQPLAIQHLSTLIETSTTPNQTSSSLHPRFQPIQLLC